MTVIKTDEMRAKKKVGIKRCYEGVFTVKKYFHKKISAVQHAEDEFLVEERNDDIDLILKEIEAEKRELQEIRPAMKETKIIYASRTV